MNINIYRKNGILNINSGGRRGAQGEAGKGVPTGGDTGQVLSKKTDTDFDTEWRDDGLSQKVNKTGDTMTGNLIIPAPTLPTHATTRSYVDNRTPIHGVGFPNGVVSAPVGTKYIDDTAHNGAIEWVKATGTGNTGWVVSVGDTGWRNIGSLFINGFETIETAARIRRVGSEVHLIVGLLKPADATANIFLGSIPGFNGGGQVGMALTSDNPSDIYNIWLANGDMAFYTKPPKNVRISIQYLTANPYPITLPGTAV